MIVNSNSGALWRKWDLHIHTPASIVQGYGGDKDEVWKKFITKLRDLPKDVKVIGINDYYFIDGYERVIREKHNGNLDSIEKIFPILEFRIDTFSSAANSKFNKINLHILFDIDEDDTSNEIQLIKEQFINQIHLSEFHETVPLTRDNLIKHSPDGTLQDGFSQIIPSTKEVFDVLDSDVWRERVLVFLGFNEWNNLDKGKQLKLFKENLYAKAAAFLTASPDDNTASKSNVLEIFGDKTFLHSLDIHDFTEFDNYKCFTWIKADPSFKGLKQALIEKSNRIFIGDIPERLQYEQDHKDQFVESIQFNSSTKGKGWFDDLPTIHLNSRLTAIIGDKGNGKSALADAIALAGNAKNSNYSFLCRSKFLSSTEHKKYSVQITFKDGYRNEANFANAKPNASNAERVKYLSQSFVNSLCDELGGADLLQTEIDRVIFSHIPREKKLGNASLPELIEARTAKYDTKLKESIKAIHEVNTEIVRLEYSLSLEHSLRVDLMLVELQRKLEAHDKAKPDNPESSDSGNLSIRLVEKYSVVQTKIENINKEKQATLDAEEIASHKLHGLIEDIANIESKKDELVEKLAKEQLLLDNGIVPGDLIKLIVNKKPLVELITVKEARIKGGKEYIEKGDHVIEKIQEFNKRKWHGLDETQSRKHSYILSHKKWEAERKKLVGSESDKDSMKWCEKEQSKINDEYPKQLSEQYALRKLILISILNCLFDKEEDIKDIYSYVQEKAERYAEKLNIPENEFIQFRPKVAISDGFKKDLFSYISQNKSGTFYGTMEGSHQLDNIIPSEGEINRTVLSEFPDSIVKALNHNLASDPGMTDNNYKTNLQDQLKGKKEKLDLYDYLYSYAYLDAKFSIAYSEKPITKLSPGEKGILLLAFYLLIDDSLLPIIIDQPEENIGNKTIYERLVKFINTAKQQRQVLIVTHNSNLAIVCDADQILLSHIDKLHNNNVTYTSGSIEYDPIKGHTIAILEGSKEAFDNRKIKYEI